MGVLDFAGGTVVHVISGISALATALMIGRRKGYDGVSSPPHNLPLTVLGAALLWFGWFGFNAGSALSAGSLATSAFVVTNTAAAAAGLGWAFMDRVWNGKPTMFGVATGAVAGLVAITPASGFVGPVSAIIIGATAGVVCFFAVTVLKAKAGYDDALDAFGVHGVGGTLGALMTGLFASTLINKDGANGLFFGNPRQLLVQAAAVGATAAYAFVSTLIIYKLVDRFVGVRVAEKDELLGLDLSQHREAAYTVLE
jgi:Amt family ammonium transporter